MTASRYTLAALICVTYISFLAADSLFPSNGLLGGNAYTLALVIIVAPIIFLWPRPKLPLADHNPVGRFRRYLAAMIDLTCLSFATFAVIFPSAYIIEWFATGSWQWFWTRDINVTESRDIVILTAYFSAYFGMYQYFWRHLQSGKPTVGQFVMGYRIIALEDAKLRQRLHSGIVALWLWPLALFKTYDKAGITYWDRDTNTRAVSTRAP